MYQGFATLSVSSVDSVANALIRQTMLFPLLPWRHRMSDVASAWKSATTASRSRRNAARASTMPAPESRSTPGASMSRAVSARISPRSSGLSDGFFDSIKAATAAACAAEAEVPKKVSNPGVAVDTLSAAARSGFSRSVPPVEETSPGVIAVPAAS